MDYHPKDELRSSRISATQSDLGLSPAVDSPFWDDAMAPFRAPTGQLHTSLGQRPRSMAAIEPSPVGANQNTGGAHQFTRADGSPLQGWISMNRRPGALPQAGMASPLWGWGSLEFITPLSTAPCGSAQNLLSNLG